MSLAHGVVLGRTDVTITNGVRMPYFELGITTNAQWESLKQRPAPFAELVTDQVVLTVPSAAARKVGDMHGLMTVMDAFMDGYPELAAVSRWAARRAPPQPSVHEWWQGAKRVACTQWSLASMPECVLVRTARHALGCGWPLAADPHSDPYKRVTSAPRHVTP